MSEPASVARRLWLRYEPFHDIIYFSPRATEEAARLGLRGFWMSYFAYRAAPLGRVEPATVTATFFGFHRNRVERALPDAWSYVTPQQAIAAREAAVTAALDDIFGPPSDLYNFAEAAGLAWRAAEAAETAGRPLAAAAQALPRSDNARIALWQATSILREHRGDGHNAVLVSRGIRPAEAHLIKIGAKESDPEGLKTGRGFPDQEWTRAQADMRARGLIDPAGLLTDQGRAEHHAIEAATDTAAEQPWHTLGEAGTRRLLDLLRPITAAVIHSGLIPRPNGVGIVWTEQDTERA